MPGSLALRTRANEGDPGRTKKIAENGSWLQHHYPYTSSLFANGTIILEVIPHEIKVASQVQRLVFPALIVQGPIDKKKKFAADFLNAIRDVCDNGYMPEYSYDDYIRLESKEVPDRNLDKLLAIRVAFLKILKDEYDKRKSR